MTISLLNNSNLPIAQIASAQKLNINVSKLLSFDLYFSYRSLTFVAAGGSSSAGGNDKKETTSTQEKQPVCDNFVAQSFKPTFCANCFNAKADHQTATKGFFTHSFLIASYSILSFCN